MYHKQLHANPALASGASVNADPSKENSLLDEAISNQVVSYEFSLCC